MSYLKSIFLFIPAVIYYLITMVRNYLYDVAWFKSQSFHHPKTIVVGNLAVGGTGKSPLVSFLLKNWFWVDEIAVLSRGYGRKTKGFRWADENSTANEIGDEPLAYHLQFPTIPVAVGEDRVAAIQKMKKERASLSYVILDDAFQHRNLRSSLPIVCTTFQQPFFEDHIMPLGRLRESRSGIKRAKALIVTRCPADLSIQQRKKFIQSVRSYAKKDLPVFFAGIHYGQPVGLNKSNITKWHLIAGIADPTLFFEQAKQLGMILTHSTYEDHHTFKKEELKVWENKAESMSNEEGILTTHKDFVRFKDHLDKYPHLKAKLSYLPMEMYFLDGDKGFWAWMGTKLGR
ncbi:MAG: tetraacyldisaccharide 4'-kinase [Aquirufa sp.]